MRDNAVGAIARMLTPAASRAALPADALLALLAEHSPLEADPAENDAVAACLVAVAAIYTPSAYGIATADGIKLESLIELSVGVAIRRFRQAEGVLDLWRE